MVILGRSFKTFALLCFSVMQRCENGVSIKNAEIDDLNITFIEILKQLGVNADVKNSDIYIKSHGASLLFEPEKEIDIKGHEAILFALVGIFASLDYTIFFTTGVKVEKSFSNLILGLYDAGVRFNYSKDFSLPMQMKGSSNLLPMVHTLTKENHLLELTLILLGLSGIGRTRIEFAKDSNFFEKALKSLKANLKTEEGVFSLALNGEILEKIELDLKNYE